MKNFFAVKPVGEIFKAFSAVHLYILLTLALICVALYIFRRPLRNERANQVTRYTLAAALILQELSLNLWRALTGTWEIQTALPLHLCGIAIIIAAVMLVSKRYSLYEVVYFWGLGGALQALLTPDLTDFPNLHYRVIQYFVSHGLIIIAVIFMTFVEKYRPTFRSMVKTLVVTNIYMVFIAIFNWLTGANYLFICRKPEASTLLDYLGPWPWYIISLEFVAIVSFTVYYLPFVVIDLFQRRGAKQPQQVGGKSAAAK